MLTFIDLELLVRKLKQFWPAFALIVAALATFLLQGEKAGFQSDHHGWVTSHHLSIVQRADASSFFVGYACDFILETGEHYRDYFNRTPFWVVALAKFLLAPVSDDIRGFIHWSRQLMNVVFVASIFVGYLLVRLMEGNRLRALFAALMTFSGYFFIYYKDMFDHNRLGTLAVLLILYAIADYELKQRRAVLVSLTLLAAAMGEAAPAVFVIIIWLIYKGLLAIFSSNRPDSIASRRWPRLLTLVSIASIVVAGGFVTYNLVVESHVNAVPLTETGIINSALHRTGLSNMTNNWEGRGRIEASPSHPITQDLKQQAGRMLYGLIPYILYRADEHSNGWRQHSLLRDRPRGNTFLTTKGMILLALSIIVIAVYIRKLPNKIRGVAILTALSGLVLLIPMRNLAYWHDFTSTFYAGFGLVFFSGVVCRLNNRVMSVFSFLALALFVANLWAVRQDNKVVSAIVSPVTEDFQRIRNYLDDRRSTIFVEGGYRKLVKGAPYSVCFYLPGSKITKKKCDAQYSIARSTGLEARLLPGNSEIHISRNTDCP